MKDTHLYEQILEISSPWYVDEVVLKEDQKEIEFHIMKHMNKAVNDVRILEHNTFNEKGDETLKGTRQIRLYGEENLPEKYKIDLEQLKEKKLKTGRAWAIKELLRDLWDCTPVDEGTTFLKGWYNRAIRSRLEPVKKVARMLKRHMRNIVSYFNCYVTNAALEGLNNKNSGPYKESVRVPQ